MLEALDGKFLSHQSLSEKDQLAIFYQKCKSNNTDASLAVDFDTSDLSLSNVFEHLKMSFLSMPVSIFGGLPGKKTKP